ncbi:hypothetical protein [Serratia silvae]|uniref:Pilus assembly protein n=1 Tax=Serratia silvae TaxID=2824122 RepID=A0ABT0KCN7_9GAMM|nr:hypothetical protein [Serratia silvae]MCL1029587.1 hypothetical protein [Serratia silvae]
MKRSLIILLACLGGAYLSDSTAAIDISPKRIELQGDTAQTITISNNGDRMEYVTIMTELLTNPGVPFIDEQRIPLGSLYQPTLYAAPFKLTLSPQQQKVITLRPLKNVDSETVYRLNIRPVVQFQGTAAERPAASIAVNLSFSALIRQQPKQQKRQLDVQCESEGVLLTASGNVHVALKAVQIDAKAPADINIYPGTPQRLQGRHIILPGYGNCLAGQRTEK